MITVTRSPEEYIIKPYRMHNNYIDRKYRVVNIFPRNYKLLKTIW